MLAGFGAIPDPARVVRDGNALTGGGITAGIDFGLTLVAELAGPLAAQTIQLMMEYAPPAGGGGHRPGWQRRSAGGLSLKQTRANLEKMVSAAKSSGARVLLVGMRMPPNLGKAYTEGFAANYRTVAEAHQVALLPFLLEPIALDRGAFQAGNIHPVAAVQPKLRDHVWPALAPLLK